MSGSNDSKTSGRVRLSEHFQLSEFTASQTAERMGRSVEASAQIIIQLERLCVMVLEPIRAVFGKPLHISSGYRPVWLNQAIGGSPSSEHCHGRAADFTIHGVSVMEVCRTIEQKMAQTLPFNQLIFEFGTWTHISICDPATAPKRQVLTAKHTGGKVVYLPGLRS